MPVRRRGRALGALLLVLLLVVVACEGAVRSADDGADGADTRDAGVDDAGGGGEGDAAGGDAAPARVDRLRLAGGSFGSPTPFGYVRGPGMIKAGLVFDTLLWRDARGETIPWLAESWEVADDGLTWRFTLREEARWHDGEPLTAADVVFSHDYIAEGPGGAAGVPHVGRVLGAPIAEVAAEDERTVVFTLDEPMASFEADVAGLWGMLVIPEHVWGDVEDPVRYRDDDAFVGSGPYRLVEHDEAAGSYLFEADDEHVLGPPLVAEVAFVPVDDEPRALERGALDVAEVALEQGVPEAQIDALAADAAILEEGGEWNMALHTNLDAGFPFDERAFRQALAHAIDRADLVDRLLLGRGEPGSTGGLAPANAWSADGLPAYEGGPEAAAELLDGLGLVDADGDGWRQLPDGEPFAIDLLASARYDTRTPELVAEQLAEVGLVVEPDVRDPADADERARAGEYALALIGYGDVGADPDVLRLRYTGEPQAFSAAHGFADERVDELAERQRRAVDADERAAALDELQAILAEELPVLSLYVPARLGFFDPGAFDAFAATPGCPPCGLSRNKLMLVTGATTLER